MRLSQKNFVKKVCDRACSPFSMQIISVDLFGFCQSQLVGVLLPSPSLASSLFQLPHPHLFLLNLYLWLSNFLSPPRYISLCFYLLLNNFFHNFPRCLFRLEGEEVISFFFCMAEQILYVAHEAQRWSTKLIRQFQCCKDVSFCGHI